MSRPRKSTNATTKKKASKVKVKRPGPGEERRRGTRVVLITPDLSNMAGTYKQPAPKRHRGPVTAGAIPGTGRPKGQSK